MCYLCNRCSGWVHSKCSGLQNAAEYRRTKDWVCSSCNSPPTLPKLQPPPIPTQAVDENSFTIMQFNANGIGNKLTELDEFLKRHNVKVVVIQESKLSSNSKTQSIQNFTTVRKDRRQGQGGGLLTLIHKSINFSRKPESPETLVEPHLEELTITATLGDTELIITNVYIPPTSSCTGGYLPSLDHLMMTTDTLILGDFNAHHSAWYSNSTDTRGTLLENVVSGSNFGILNWDSPTRLPGNANPSSPDVSLASASLITSTNSQTKTNLGSDHLPILISLQMDHTINPIPHRTSFNLKKANWDRYSKEIEDKLSKRRLPSNCQKGEKILRTIILKAASRHIPSGRHRINTEPVPAEILQKVRARDIQHCIQYITNIPHSVLTGDVNAHSTLWHSYTDDHRGQLIADVISNSDHITLNTNTPTRVPNTTLQQTSSPDITTVSNTLYNRTSWTTQHALSSDHLPIITTINIRHDYRLQQNRRTFTNYKKADWTQFTEDTESAFAQTTIPTNIHTANRIFTNIILMADKQNIPKGKMHSNCRLLPEDIVCKITQRNNIRRANTCDPALKLLNEEITSDIQKHKQNIWKEHLDAHWDHRHNTHTLWKTIHGLSNRAPPHTLNTSITFNNKIATTPTHIANCFTKTIHKHYQAPTHKTNRHINRATHNIQGYNITLTTSQVQDAIKQSKNNNSQGPDKLNIRHLNT